jgi:peptidoglycan/xylan/chitin deacetylase (PgdA/CDA1 family)
MANVADRGTYIPPTFVREEFRPMIENPVPWPDGARAAVSFSFDVDAESLIHLAYPEDATNRISTLSYLRYGPQVGVPRLCKLFEDFGLKASFFVPAWCAEEYPRAIERILEGGHEIGHHGYLHEEPGKQTRERERYWTERAFTTLERITGRKPIGYRAPNYSFSRHTADILADFGFLYDSSLMADDVPYMIETPSGRRLIEIPVHWSVDDWSQYAHNFDLEYSIPIRPPSKAIEVYLEDFEAIYAWGGFLELVWHPFLSARPARVMAIRSMIEQILDKGDVWVTTTEDIAHHVKGLIEDGRYRPRLEKLPYEALNIE